MVNKTISILIPEEKVSDEEMAEILDIIAKIRRSERTRLDNVPFVIG